MNVRPFLRFRRDRAEQLAAQPDIGIPLPHLQDRQDPEPVRVVDESHDWHSDTVQANGHTIAVKVQAGERIARGTMVSIDEAGLAVPTLPDEGDWYLALGSALSAHASRVYEYRLPTFVPYSVADCGRDMGAEEID